MSNNAQQLFKLANSLAKFVEDNEKIALPLFVNKLAQAHRDYPEDHTIGMTLMVVSKMANSDKLLISRAEINDLYERFYTRNTKFASVFEEEIGQPVVVDEVVKSSFNGSELPAEAMQEARDSFVDPVLASALDRAFGGSSVKEYNLTLAKQAASICANRFQTLGFKVQSEVVCGKDGVMICSVGFETPRGTTSLLVPVETEVGNITYAPLVFVGNDGSHDISKEAIVKYLTTKAGDKLNIKAEEVLNTVLAAKNEDREISDVELALTRLNAVKENQNHVIGPKILGVEVAQTNPNLILELPTIENPEITAIAKTFDSELGFAKFKFGNKAVDQGRSLIIAELNNCGIDSYNIAVMSCNDDGITYSVGLNGGSIAFKVPIKVEGGNVYPPSILICNGSAKSFDANSVNILLKEEGFDRTAAVSASPLYGVKPSELVNTVRSAVAEGNYIKAEDALNVLASSEDDKAYQTALMLFSKGLGNKESHVSDPVHQCSMIVKSKHSQYDICGHTGLPLHKVAQDKHGNCLPKYREAMSDSYEGANFMHSKVFFQ